MTVEARLLEIVDEVARLERDRAAQLVETPIEVEIVSECADAFGALLDEVRPGMVPDLVLQRATTALGRVRIYLGAASSSPPARTPGG